MIKNDWRHLNWKSLNSVTGQPADCDRTSHRQNVFLPLTGEFFVSDHIRKGRHVLDENKSIFCRWIVCKILSLFIQKQNYFIYNIVLRFLTITGKEYMWYSAKRVNRYQWIIPPSISFENGDWNVLFMKVK